MNANRFTDIHRILIRSANWVGDAIMTTPAIRMIRSSFPGAHITLLAKPWVTPVFQHNPTIDDIMVYEANGRHRGMKGVLKLAGDVGRQRFDLAILFQNAFEAALIAWLARIPRRLGYTTDGRTLLLTDRMRTWRPLKKGHLVDYYIGLLSEAGLNTADRSLCIYLTQQEQRQARETLRNLDVGEDSPLIGINPGATFGTAKRWPADRYIALSRKFIQEQHATVLIFGGPGETALGDEIAARTGAGCLNLCNQTTLRQAMALIGCCNAFVTNDSGLMHVAAALDIPQIAIIGPTDPIATGPVNRVSRIVQAVGSCDKAPCLLPHCPIDHRCMLGIDVDTVFDATCEIIREKTA